MMETTHQQYTGTSSSSTGGRAVAGNSLAGNSLAGNSLTGSPMGGPAPSVAGPTGTLSATAAATAAAGTATVGNKVQEIHRIAAELFRQQPDWVTFFREVLGIDGVIRRVCPSATELTALEQTTEYQEIQQMLAKLRERRGAPADGTEPTRVITVRLPKSLHESLRTEAHEKRTSMNKLCISKLLQMVDEGLIPND